MTNTTVNLTLPKQCHKYADSAWASIAELVRAHGYRWIAESIEEQVKPAIEEPTEFGSLVRARSFGPLSMLWQRSPVNGKHYWESENGAVDVWSELTDVEVLRVGIGENDDFAVGEAFTAGVRNTVARGTRVLKGFRDQALTAERKDAYQNAINVLRELS
jgi:hypothetical protein